MKERGFYAVCLRYGLLLFIFQVACTQQDSNQSESLYDSGIIQNQDTTETLSDNNKSIIEIRFIPITTYGDTDDIILGRIQQIAVDKQGRVFLSDRDKVEIHVFHSNGSYLQSIGRQGQGPGEFQNISRSTFMEFHSGRLYVPDGDGRYLHRVHVFSLDNLSFSHTIDLRAGNKEQFDKDLKYYYPRGGIYPLKDGNFLVPYTFIQSRKFYQRDSNFVKYYIQSESGKIKKGPILEQYDRIFLYHITEGNYLANSFPFLGKPLFVINGDGYMYAAWSEDFQIEAYQPDGKKLHSIRPPYQNQPLTQSDLTERIQICDEYFADGICEQMVRNADNLPETWPALNDLLIDDENRLWVSTIVEDFDIYEWWVLEETGELVTRFEWPRDEPIEVIKNGYMYTRQTDDKTGLQQVVRYRIVTEEV
ncbi:MAG: 6-bladed beta-propeller [Balneolaceae bacterium]|nr:6-bladed beta-propeller [Balneolaceae bacterium]